MERTIESRWRVQQAVSSPARLETVTLAAGPGDMTFGEVVDGWRDDVAFRDFFLAELARTPWPAFFWEMPPISHDTLDRRYEYVAIGAPELEDMPADPLAFQAQLDALESAKSVTNFANLGGDAILVVPKLLAGPGAYGHLGAFLRTAPDQQKHELLTSLAQAIETRLRRRQGPLWVSTSGLGVAWLHVRLDSHPKYYQYGPYRRGP